MPATFADRFGVGRTGGKNPRVFAHACDETKIAVLVTYTNPNCTLAESPRNQSTPRGRARGEQLNTVKR